MYRSQAIVRASLSGTYSSQHQLLHQCAKQFGTKAVKLFENQLKLASGYNVRNCEWSHKNRCIVSIEDVRSKKIRTLKSNEQSPSADNTNNVPPHVLDTKFSCSLFHTYIRHYLLFSLLLFRPPILNCLIRAQTPSHRRENRTQNLPTICLVFQNAILTFHYHQMR